jgi:hypothetical protein
MGRHWRLTDVMAGGQRVGAELLGGGQQVGGTSPCWLQDAGDRRLAGEIALGEGLDHRLAEALS